MNEDNKQKLKKLIDNAHDNYIKYDNYQMGCKILINSYYGAFGFSMFPFYNRDIAESVTLQGKDAILYAEKNINDYFHNIWSADHETHKRLGVKHNGNDIKDSVSVYIDTDSVYSQLSEVMSTTDWMEHKVWKFTKTSKEDGFSKSIYVSSSLYPTEEDAKKYFEINNLDLDVFEYILEMIEPDGREFALTVDRVFLSSFFQDIFEKYSADYFCKNYLNFELESYADAGIWLAKKKYVQNIVWTDPDVYYDNLSYIKPKGIELAQSSSSKWVRSKLEYLIKWIFSHKNFEFADYVKELSNIKKEFKLRNIEDISINQGMNKYDEYVINDTNKIELKPKTMVTVQGAALFNYMLNNNKSLKKKYNAITDSKKLNIIYIKPNKRFVQYKQQTNGTFIEEPCKTLAFNAGDIPIEILTNFEVDRDKMFELLILQPMNRIVESMGYKSLDSSLIYTDSIFDF